MEVVVRNTMKLIFDYEQFKKFENKLTIFDSISRQPKEYFFHSVPSNHPGIVLAIPRHFPNVALRELFGENLPIQYRLNRDCFRVQNYPHVKHQPYENQIKIIEWLSDGGIQKVVTADTGVGKTYIANFRAAQLQTPTIIITHLTGIRDQWVQRIKDHLTCDDDQICVVTGREPEIDFGKGYLFYLMTHKTATMMIEHNPLSFQNLVYNGRIGLKVIDECHLNLKSTFLIDTHSDIAYNIYLSATADRTDWRENIIFKYVVPQKYHSFGEEVHTNDHYHVYVVEFDSAPFRDDVKKIVTRRGLSLIHYGDYLSKIPEIHDFVFEYMTWIEGMDTGYVNKQHAVLFSRIKECDNFARYVMRRTGFGPAEVVVLHSQAKGNSEFVKDAKILVTTKESFGTGMDTDVDVIYNLVPFRSRTKQVIGRLRKNRSAIFVDFCDVGFAKCVDTNRTRYKYYKDRAQSLERISHGPIRSPRSGR